MKHTYQIEGMTCKGCLRNVKSALSDIPGVTDVDIDLDASVATIQMENHIPIEKLEEAVQKKKSKYHVHPPIKPDGARTRTFDINGMTCNGCKAHVEKTLSKVDGVKNVTVDLEKAEAKIDMTSEIAIEQFQDVLKNDGARTPYTNRASALTLRKKQ